MPISASLINLAQKLATGSIDKYEFKNKLGKSPEEALNLCAKEVGECAKKHLQGNLNENSERYVKARETALYLAGCLKPKGRASHLVNETISGVVNFTLYAFKRKCIPGDYMSCTETFNDGCNPII